MDFRVEKRVVNDEYHFVSVSIDAESELHAECAQALIEHEYRNSFSVGKLWVNFKRDYARLTLVYDPSVINPLLSAEVNEAIAAMECVLKDALDRSRDIATILTATSKVTS